MKKLYVQSIIDYVEDHIEDPISLDIIAAHIGYSKFYLHKLFYIYTGMYIMEYTRKRKLAYSLQDLQTDRSILAIALTYGFGSERTYSRAFRNVYGISPGKYRNNTCVLAPKLILSQLGGIRMLPYLSEPKTVTINQMYALTHTVISNDPETEVINFMTDYRMDNKIQVYTEVGFDVPVAEEQSHQGLRGYEYWIIVDEKTYKNHNDNLVVKKEVPKGTYLMLTIEDPFVDPFERIPTGWKKLWSAVEKEYKFRNDSDIYGFEEKIDTLYNTSMNLYVLIE